MLVLSGVKIFVKEEGLFGVKRGHAGARFVHIELVCFKIEGEPGMCSNKGDITRVVD